MNSKAADRIRAMKEKGTITPEQAEELLGVIAEETQEEPGRSRAERDGRHRGRRRRSRRFLRHGLGRRHGGRHHLGPRGHTRSWPPLVGFGTLQ